MMNRCAALLLLAGVLGALPVHAAFINGRSYVAMSDWAPGNGFHLVTRSGGSALYTDYRGQTRLQIQRNSHVALINGIEVALSFPVALDRGDFYVSQLDLATTISPLVFGPKWRAKIGTICIDPGHGGKDTGNVVGSRAEKTYTLLLAQELASQLRAAGFNAILTRRSDTFIELPARPDIANRRNADLFISLHFNATPTSKATVSGVETYCITPVGASSSNSEGRGAGYGSTPANRVGNRSLLLAYLVQKSLVRNLPAEDRAVRRARFAVLREAEMPAILVESGYMSHPTEGRKIFDAAYRRQIASAIVQGVVNYQKLTGTGTTASPAPAAKSKSATGKRTK